MRVVTLIKGLAAASLLSGAAFASEPVAAKNAANVTTLASQLKSSLHARCTVAAGPAPSQEAMMETIAELAAGQDIGVIEAALANVVEDGTLCANAKAAASTANELARLARARGEDGSDGGDRDTLPIFAGRGAPQTPAAAYFIVGVPGGAGGPGYQQDH